MDKLFVGLYNLGIGQIVMFIIGGILIYLAVRMNQCCCFP